MRDVEVIEDPAAAVVALDPVRAMLLGELDVTGLGRRRSPSGSASPARRSTTT